MKQALYNDVWQQLLDAERCYRYHSELADRYRKYQKIPRWIMAASSGIRVDEKLNEKSQKEGFKVISDRYVSSEIQTT